MSVILTFQLVAFIFSDFFFKMIETLKSLLGVFRPTAPAPQQGYDYDYDYDSDNTINNMTILSYYPPAENVL